MALARVVTFEGVDSDHMASMKEQMETGEQPEGVPATEFIMLHDPSSDKAVAIIFFESDEDYATGHATLDAMPTGDTPGTRTSVTKYEVASRMTA